MKIRTLKEINPLGRKILLRIDINSPVANSKVLDNPRFESSAITLKYLLNKKAKVIIIAHQGRKGDKDFTSLKQHSNILSKYVGSKIKYIDDLFGDDAINAIKELKNGEAIILKNVREFNDETNLEKKDNKYIKFCKLFDLYVNDAFSVSHRAQGSIIIPPKHLSSFIGLEFERELAALTKFKNSDGKSKIFILGGAKVEDYFSLFKFLNDKRTKILASGVLGNLFLVAQGHDLGFESKWLKQNGYFNLIPKLKEILSKYEGQIITPIDFGLNKNRKRIAASIVSSPFNYKINDIGEGSVELFKGYLKNADYVFMKGPLGFIEIKEFSNATKEILKEVSSLTKNKKIFSLIGGGHLTTTMKIYKIPNNFSYISMSGGALIKFISGEKLPGIEALVK